MSPDTGEYLILWTARASVACYVAALWCWLFAGVRQRRSDSAAVGPADRVYILFWSGAWLLCVLHVVCAFQFRHHWVHSAALQHTADMTERVVGINWGGGLYINYAFLICWGVSLVQTLRTVGHLSWGTPVSETFMQGFAAFMMFNATAVFGPWWWWLPAIFVVAAVFYRKLGVRQPNTQQ
ncbi:MAG: hypothetical protein MK102_04730 [Fuerstiella sp.]|nr:hypothetical protein [Fuerstiella sp.]